MTQPQNPGYQAVTSETPRVLKRGQLEVFFFTFFYDKNETQPVLPLEPQRYPSFSILSPNGDRLYEGTAVPAGSPGFWRVGWVVPRNAELTNIYKRYTFQVTMVDAQLRQFETSFEFDVVETAVPAQKPELQQLVVFVGDPLRISFVNTVRPEFLQVRVTPREHDCAVVHFAQRTSPPVGVPGPSDLREVERDNYFVYYTDIPSFATTGEWSVKWNVRDFTESPNESEHQAVEVIRTSTMFLVKDLRILIDKLQKKMGIVYAYTDADLISHLRRGVAYVNGISPPSYFALENFPKPLESFVILAAAWLALSAQRILYAETNFDFSGQTVTLTYNPGADIESVATTFKEAVDTQVAKTKVSLLRAGSPVGFIATRPLRNRSSLVFKTQTYTGASNNLSNVYGILQDYGLFFDY